MSERREPHCPGTSDIGHGTSYVMLNLAPPRHRVKAARRHGIHPAPATNDMADPFALNGLTFANNAGSTAHCCP